MRSHHALALIATAGLAAAARADVNWTTQIGFAASNTGPVFFGNTLTISAPGTYTFIARVGIFNVSGLAPGQFNQGLATWSANIAATGMPVGGTLGVLPTASRAAPFDHGPGTLYGGRLTDPTHIDNVVAQRDLSGGASSSWAFEAPMPTTPTPGALGVESLTNVFRFTLTIPSVQAAEVHINFTGSAGPVLRWDTFSSVEPVDPNSPGNVHFTGLTPQPALREYTPTTFVVILTPTPAAPLLFALAAPVCCARRRRPAPRPLP